MSIAFCEVMVIHLCIKITYLYFCCCRCDVQQNLPRQSNKVTIRYKFVIYKNKKDKGDHSQDVATVEETVDKTAEETVTGNSKLESPSKTNTSITGIIGRAADLVSSAKKKVASGVKTVGKTLGNVFSKSQPHIEFEKLGTYTVVVFKNGTDQKGNSRRFLTTTYLIRHVDIKKCDSVSISIFSKYCDLSKAHLFMRFT